MFFNNGMLGEIILIGELIQMLQDGLLILPRIIRNFIDLVKDKKLKKNIIKISYYFPLKLSVLLIWE
jgi:hypothetical protein